MEAKNDSTCPTVAAIDYTPGSTLGRSVVVDGPSDRLHMKANQLDALLTLMTGATAEDGMLSFNSEIQRQLLNLASELAYEVNEAQEELMSERIARSAS